jgi:integrase
MASIKKLPNGKAQVSWYDSKGVRHRPVLPFKEAQALYEQVIAETFLERTGVTNVAHRRESASKLFFREIAQRYMDEHLIAESRAANNSYYVRILIGKWGDYRLKMLDTAAFRKWVRFALHNPINVPGRQGWKLFQLSASSVDKLVRYTMAIFNWSMEQGIIDHNPLSRIKDWGLRKEFRRKKNYKPVFLTAEEFWVMVSDWPAYVRDPAAVCFFSGIRRSELGAIRWSRVDVKAHRFEFEAEDVKEADAKHVYYDCEIEEVLERLEIDYIAGRVRG